MQHTITCSCGHQDGLWLPDDAEAVNQLAAAKAAPCIECVRAGGGHINYATLYPGYSAEAAERIERAHMDSLPRR